MSAAFDSDVSVTVEAGFGSGPFATSISWTDISSYVRSAWWSRGRPSVQQDFPAGTGELVLDNSDGRFHPWNTGSAYSPDVTVGVPIRIRATYSATTYGQFFGYVRSWDGPSPNKEELVTVPLTERWSRLVGKKVSASFSAASTDTRVGDILDEAGWPSADRSLESGVAAVAAIDVQAQSVLQLLRDTAEAEQGQIFQDADGNAVFKNRVAASSASSAATFGPGASELTYTDVSTVTDDDLLFNEALITGADGSEQSATDATSIAAQGPNTYDSTNDSIVGAPAALNVAEWIVGKYAGTQTRILPITIDPAGDPTNLWPEVLARELRDVITVKVTYDHASVTLSQAVSVEQIKHSFQSGGVWTVTYGCAPLSDLEQTDFWVLGTSALGSGTVLA